MGNYFICLLTDCIYTKTVQNDFKLFVKFYIYTIKWCGRRGGGGVQDRGEEIVVQRSNHYTNLYILVGFL